MVKKVILTMLLSMVVVLMVGTAAFAAPPEWPPASCAAHCATFFGGSGDVVYSVSAQAKLGWMGGPDGTAQMGNCGSWEALCCANWVEKFSR